MAHQAETTLKIDMELADIPGTSLRVSRVAIGTWAIGGWKWGGTDEAASISTIRAALEHGINVIDTAPSHRRTKLMIFLNDARRVIAAAEAKAHEIGQPMNIAVVDGDGNLVSQVRMDGAWIGSVDIAINKAFTARAFDISTAELAANSQPGQQFFGIHGPNQGRVMIFAGGMPLRRNGAVVGAIGVSGGSGSQDEFVAMAGASIFAGRQHARYRDSGLIKQLRCKHRKIAEAFPAEHA